LGIREEVSVEVARYANLTALTPILHKRAGEIPPYKKLKNYVTDHITAEYTIDIADTTKLYTHLFFSDQKFVYW